MKRVKCVFLYLLIIMQIFTGCNASDRKASSDMLQNTENSDTINDRYKDKAVIIETVADIFKEAEINSERVTQGLFNQLVTVLEERENWVKVKTVDGSTGWLRSKFIDRDCTSVKKEIYSERIVITGKRKAVFTNYGGGATLKDVVMGTEFYIKGKKKNYYEVIVPGKRTGWVEMKSTIQLLVSKPIPKTTAADFADTAKKFVGTQYLMGGVSSWQGIDSSGIVYICARINGIDLPRGIMDQFELIKVGPASIDEIKPGDLVFISSNEDLAETSDIGVYVGDNQIIYASKAKGSVEMTELNSDYFLKRIKGIKRIF